MQKLVIAGLGGVALLGGFAAWMLTSQNTDAAFAQCSASTVAGGAIGGPFTLVSETGETVTEADVITKPSLIYFGFTFCPDVCPLDTVRNADAVDLLAERGHDVQPVFITVDPDRDTPEVMAEFTELVHEDMLGLTGSAEQIKSVAQAYKVYYNKHDSDDEYYLVDHSTHSYLMLPEHGFVEFYRRDATAEAIADSVACYAEASS